MLTRRSASAEAEESFRRWACAMVCNGRMVPMCVRSPAGCNRHAFHANSAIPWTMLALEG